MANTTISITQTPRVGNWADVAQTLTLRTTKVDHKVTNKLQIDKSKPQTDITADPEKTMLDLKLVDEALHVEGFLLDETDTSVSTTLAEGLDASETSIIVADSNSFPAYGAIIVGKEIIQYTHNDGVSLLTGCTRGYAGSLATIHDNGYTIYKCNPAVHQKQKIVDFIKTGKNFTSFVWGDETFNTDYGGVYLEDAVFDDADMDKVGNTQPEFVKFQYALTILIGIVK